MKRRQFIKNSVNYSSATLGLSMGMGLPLSALAQSSYPERAVEFIVPWSPGGDSDLLMRVVANHLEKILGQAVPIINMPGVSGTQGLKDANKRKPDGYTISQIHEGLLTGHYSGLTDLNWSSFDLIGQITASYQYIAVNGKSKWQTFDDLIQDAIANPETIRAGVTLGGVPHLQMAMIEEATGAKFSYVGYEGTAERTRALVGNNVDVISADSGTSDSFIQTGDMRLLVAGSPERSTELPDIPTMQELGFDIELSVTRGLVAPKGTNPEIIATLTNALEEISKDSEFQQSIKNVGSNVSYLNPTDYAAKLERIEAVIKKLTNQLVN